MRSDNDDGSGDKEEEDTPSTSDVMAWLGWLTARLRHLADQK